VILSELINQPPKSTDRNHSVKWAFGIGTLKRWGETFEKRFGIPIYEGWSFVEGVGITINKIGSKGGKFGSVGKSMRGFEFKIVDEHGKELPSGANHIGEIACRTILPFELEYYHNTEENVTVIGKNRWVYSGDYGYKDNEDYIYFVGRKTDMILKNKERIFAIDIEEIANNHPNVIESAVFGVPNEEKTEEDIKLCVVLKNKQIISHEEFSNYLFQNMAYYLVPKYIEFKDKLPKNGNGLIKKFILRKECESDISKRNTWDTEKKKFILNH
jgi:crotonobetaine/carnitine-CoA ligase